MKTLLPARCVALAVAGSALAQAPGPVQPGAYRVEPNHTRVLFGVSHLGFTTYYGEFVGVSGGLNLDPARIEASHVAIRVPIDGVSTPSEKLTGELKGPAWFDAARFPLMTFRSTTIRRTGPTTAD